MKCVPAIATCLVLFTAAANAQPAASAREPGVLVRLYEIGLDMRQVPDLAPGQTPNAVNIAKQIDLRTDSAGFAPLKEQFVAEVLGYVSADPAGAYTFRLTSDDGARLWIDGRLVVDNDGAHGAVPKDGHLELAAGEHELRIAYFQAGGDGQLTLEWQPPRAPADKFGLVPASALTHAGDASKETSPGKKRIVPPLRRGRPGDGRAVAGPHPSFEMTNAFGMYDGERQYWDRDGHIRVIGVADSTHAGPVVAWVPPDEADQTYLRVLGFFDDPYKRQVFLVSKQAEGKRIGIDAVDTTDQGVVFRFGNGTWVRRPTEKVTFEMLAVRAMTNGFEIEFTKPLDARVGCDPESYYVEQWPFDLEKKTAPARDGTTTPVKSASVSADRRKVFLEIPGLKTSNVVYIRLLPPCLAEDGELPWSTEAWYTLNAIPKDRPGQVLAPPKPEPQNLLADAEQKEGWRLLFDGKTTQGWHGYKKTTFPDGWQVKDGCLVRVAGGGDIVTNDEFDNFELKLEWRISPGGNSGIMYRVSEDEDQPWRTGPEMQVLDNAEHADGRNPLTSAGSNYGLYAPVRDVTRPVGLFNEVRLVVNGPHVEHWLNGVKIVEYELGSPEWEKLVAASKFSTMPRCGREKKGHIDLQDHGDLVWYRNIKIRPMSDSPK